MKKIIVVFALLLSLNAIAQIFPDKRPELLQDQLIKVDPSENYSKGYVNFYSDMKAYASYAPSKEISTQSRYDSLVGRIFKVVNIEKYDSYGDIAYKLKLEDTLNKKILFYKHSPRYPDTHQLEIVSTINYPGDFYCDYLTEVKGAYKGEADFKSKAGYITVVKSIKDKITTYKMDIEARSDYDSKLKKGVIITLENNKKIVKPNAVVLTELNYPFYDFTSNFALTKEDLALLMDNKIISYKLLDDDKQDTYDADYAEKMKGMIRCLITK